ncbi:DUF2179 domain-containing protein [Halobacillus salinus]|uniref:UPF0316 protein E4663_17960 n=1 Tax=Halobacillus salinus TaxID=192814 RepID=A0A4Z0GUX9_9BACI|nr:DUF2179 domain-containing protein [Halobacillus salinus]TGB01037.1 DUF2179 domain-containing protein [Halobacillus salinus]
MENPWLIVAIILVVNIVYVSFFTLRMIFTLKGQRYFAAFISMFEIVTYIYGLGIVLDRLDQWINVVAYAVGYGLGVICGMKIEEKLALGYITVNVISSDPDIEFTRKLRDKGYGVTSWYAYGMEGDRLNMQILTPRKYELVLYQAIQEIDPKAFIVAYEPKQIHGGFWAKSVKKGKIQRAQEEQQQKAL